LNGSQNATSDLVSWSGLIPSGNSAVDKSNHHVTFFQVSKHHTHKLTVAYPHSA